MPETLKRFIVWALETLSEALLLGVAMVSLLGSWNPKQPTYAKDVLFAFVATLFAFMWGSGYLLTTAFFRVALRSPGLWLYPLVASALFITHVQFFATGWDLDTKLSVQIGGACIVVACTLIGGWYLRKWINTAGNTVHTT